VVPRIERFYTVLVDVLEMIRSCKEEKNVVGKTLMQPISADVNSRERSFTLTHLQFGSIYVAINAKIRMSSDGGTVAILGNLQGTVRRLMISPSKQKIGRRLHTSDHIQQLSGPHYTTFDPSRG
jgi:hypothetical protein